MIRWEHRYLGRERFPETLSALDTEQFFTLSDGELSAVQERRGMPNRQGLALQIGFLKMTGSTFNSVELIPTVVLEAIGRQLKCQTPVIASIRAFYRQRRTLFDHQAAALKALGRTELGHAERGLVAYLRREAASVFELTDLMDRARSWMVDHDYLLLREKDNRRIALAARRYQDDILFKSIETAARTKREMWVRSLLAPVGETTTSNLEWLGTVSSSKAFKGLEDQIDKVSYLKELGAERLVLPELPIIGLEYFARRMLARKPSALSRIREPQRTIEIACFLRLTLLRLTDSSLTLVDHQIAVFWRGARERAEAPGARRHQATPVPRVAGQLGPLGGGRSSRRRRPALAPAGFAGAI